MVPLRPEVCQLCLVNGLRDNKPEGLGNLSSVDAYEMGVSFKVVDFVTSSDFEAEDACSVHCSW